MRKRTASLLTLASALALGAQAAPVQAATTTWTVTNPNADGSFTTSGPLTAKNAAGQTLFTCANIPLIGVMGSGSKAQGQPLGRITAYYQISCTGGDGQEWFGIPATIIGPSYFRGTGFDASTGKSTIDHRGATPTVPVYIFGQRKSYAECTFFVQSVAGTYSNATSTLKTTTAETRIGTPEGGEPSCQGLLSEGETITFDGALKFDPAIEITATTS